MVGRILRPFDDKKTGYKKDEALFFDHVNLIQEHYDPEFPGVPLFYLKNIDWNFNGHERRKKEPCEKSIKLCPWRDFMYCDKPSCVNCPYNKGNVTTVREALQTVDINLVEKEKPIAFTDRKPEEKREIIDRINNAIEQYKQIKLNGGLQFEPVNEMIKIADELNYNIMWVYKKFTENDKIINSPLLHEIARIKKYKKGWAYFKTQELKKYRSESVIK